MIKDVLVTTYREVLVRKREALEEAYRTMSEDLDRRIEAIVGEPLVKGGGKRVDVECYVGFNVDVRSDDE